MAENDKNEAQLFEEIIRGQEIQDAGIVSYGERMREFEENVRKRYVERGFAHIPADDLEGLGALLNESWPYHSEIGVISGKLELLNDEDEDVLRGLLADIAEPNKDGEILFPETDETYSIAVYNKQLLSAGAIIDVMYDDNNILKDIRVGYVFYHPEDDEQDTPLFASYDALDKHFYEKPSAVEARVRLESKWPKQLEVIDVVLESENPLPERLLAMVDALKDDLRDSNFRELVEIYLNEELQLETVLPYITAVRERIDLLEDVESETERWHRLEVDGSLTVFLIAPEVRLTSMTEEVDTLPEGHIRGVAYNDEDGSKPEMVSIPVRNMDRFVSTRMTNSLASLAIGSMNGKIEEDIDSILLNANSVKFSENAPEDVEVHNVIPENIRQLERLEESFVQVQQLADVFRKKTFAKKEDALNESKVLLVKIQELLNGTTFYDGGHYVSVIGQHVTAPNFNYNMHWDAEKQVFIHGVHADEPDRELPLGDTAIGIIDQLYPQVEKVFESQTDPENTFYSPRVEMQIVTARATNHAADGVRTLSKVKTVNEVAVPLDSSSEIQLIELERYRAVQQGLEKAEKVYGKDSALMELMYQLEGAFAAESPNSFTTLDSSLVSRIPSHLNSAVRRYKKSAGPAATVLEAMFSNRIVLAKGDMYIRTEEGRFVSEEGVIEDTVNWRVVDVKPSNEGDDLMMFMYSLMDGRYRYMPFSSVTRLEI